MSTTKNTKQQKTITCKYINQDKYKNYTFLVSEENDELKDDYIKVRKYYKILSTKYTTNLPIWVKKEDKIATIRFKKSPKLSKLKPYAIYKISFNFYESKAKGKVFCNMIVEDIKLIKEQDNGKQLDIESDIEISDSDEEE